MAGLSLSYVFILGFTLVYGQPQLGIAEEKAWIYKDCNGIQKTQVDTRMGIAYIEAPLLNVLIDFSTKEVAFNFKDPKPVCLVTPLDESMFSEDAIGLEMLAAQLSMLNDAGDPKTFKKFKIVKKSEEIKMEDHFKTAEEKRLIKSDLIVEVCQDYSKLLAIATVQPLSDSSNECSDASLHCILKSKVCPVGV